GHEWTRAEGAQDAVMVVYAGRVVGAAANLCPALRVIRGERDDAGRAGGAAGLVHALDGLGRHARVGSEGRRLVDRVFELLLGRERKAVQVAKGRASGAGGRLAKLPSVEGRGLEEAAPLTLPGNSGLRLHLLPGRCLDPAIPDPVPLAPVA